MTTVQPAISKRLTTRLWKTRVPDGFVSVTARGLRAARLCWVNKSWFQRQGVQVDDPYELEFLQRWILRHYAFVVPRPEDSSSEFDTRTRIFYADRYGEAGVVPHGGSGRAASSGDFSVKGIGITSLVGEGSDWLHSHGCLWMEEALREIVFSEHADRVLPGGALPSVALIDTGLHAEMPKGSIGERRALLLRPNALRFAHWERAAYFRRSRLGRQEQSSDVARVRQTIAFCASEGDVLPERLTLASQTMGKQLAALVYRRLSLGGISSSSFTLDGKAVDFGGARSLPDWRVAETKANFSPFGSELSAWLNVCASWSYQLTKHGVAVDIGDISTQVSSVYAAHVEQLAAETWGVAGGIVPVPIRQRVVEAMCELIRRQQGSAVSYVGSRPEGLWPYVDAVTLTNWLHQTSRPDMEPLKTIEELLSVSLGNRGRDLFLDGMARLRPSPFLDREELQRLLFEHVIPRNASETMRSGAVDGVLEHLAALVPRL